ncbi:ABC transporter permease [Clostridium tertium]|jgi:peptide/nickel transport system permease protein|uniref:ABC transporter permease n=1 Tax=Clostridium tertium TaxID=1559 RepID=A0A9X4B3F8_9CLOT|nr:MULTISPECIES: ABC transporter permease [Clostridium]MBP1866689.1 peptide/nickel transport system permease protein [Clostridium tertium]MBS5307464.1 ABC transporter permease [Clostridium sp.]MBS5885254.1 ABC transporter permease [Clostridium sp.]MBU6137144.1 ABC transporter permease [Clostridium tertium]MDB1924266.1 ABC transporter permease [Clostridium tertium]
MVKFIIKKILGLIPMLLLITFIIYLGLELTPGDAVSHMISPELLSNMDPAKLDEIRAAYGLNDPFILRYFRWLGEILRGNFGYSVSSGVPIINIIKDLLPATLELAIAALLISTILGSLLGLFSAIRRGTFSENLLTVAGMIGVSIPQFFFGMVCILIFSLNLGWLPVGGRMMPGKTAFIDRYEYLILPALVLGISLTAGVMRYARSSMLDTMNKEYIRTARSKGLPEWRVNLVHGFRVALTPVIVLIGFRLPTLIGGAVVIETIFRWPGIGSAFATAVRAQNYPLVMMIALLTVTAVLVSSFLVDVLTALLDPRVKLD